MIKLEYSIFIPYSSGGKYLVKIGISKNDTPPLINVVIVYIERLLNKFKI